MSSNNFEYYKRDGEFMILHNDKVIRSHIKTFKQAVKDGRSLSWLSGDVKVVKVVCDAKEV